MTSHIEKGDRFGRLTAVEEVGREDKSGSKQWRCLCDCGREYTARATYLLGGRTTQCAQWDHDILGKRFAYLTVEDYDHSDAHGNAFFQCRCDCGNETVVRGDRLRNGTKRSCGCME